MKQLYFLGFFSLLFSGCSISAQSEDPVLFVPKDSASASVFGTNPSQALSQKTSHPQSLLRENTEFFLIAQTLSPNQKQEFRLYSNDKKPCADSRETVSNLCIFEVWEKENVFDEEGKRGDLGKIYFFEETESGQFFEYYGGNPISWADEEFIIFEKISENKSGIKHVFSGFDPRTQEQKRLYQIAFWKDFTSQEKNGLMSITKNGTQYFFDPESYGNAFRGYRVGDPSKPFYVKSSGLENLSFIDALPEKNIQHVQWKEDFSGILFEVDFMDKENKEQSKTYEFSGLNGFVERKISG